MEIAERLNGNVVVLDLTGRLILSDGEEPLRRKIDELVERGQMLVLLNFQNVSYLDSAGVGAVVWKYVTLRRAGGSLKLLNLRPRSHRVLNTTKLLTVMENFDSESDAVASFASSPGPSHRAL